MHWLNNTLTTDKNEGLLQLASGSTITISGDGTTGATLTLSGGNLSLDKGVVLLRVYLMALMQRRQAN